MSKNGSNKTSVLKESGLSSTLNLCFKAIYEVYFQPQEVALPYYLRFSFSFAGSMIFLHFTVLETGFKLVEIISKSTAEGNAANAAAIGLILSDFSLLLFTLSIGILYGLFFAFVIAAGYSKHGAVRYFISGVILPAFTLLVMQSVSII